MKEQPPTTNYCSNPNFSAVFTERERLKRINRVQELNIWAKTKFRPKNIIFIVLKND
jgi:hypothetical protein